MTDANSNINAEQELENERRLFSAGPVMMIIWGNAEQLPVRYVSSNVCDILGYTPEEFTAVSFSYPSIKFSKRTPTSTGGEVNCWHFIKPHKYPKINKLALTLQ